MYCLLLLRLPLLTEQTKQLEMGVVDLLRELSALLQLGTERQKHILAQLDLQQDKVSAGGPTTSELFIFISCSCNIILLKTPALTAGGLGNVDQ